MKSSRTFFLLATALGFLVSCSSPQKAFESKKYKKSIKLATRSLAKGKNIEENKNLIELASQHHVEETLAANAHLVASPDVDDWITVQSKYYKTLEVIGKANKVSDGTASAAYEELCDYKSDLDFGIAEYFRLEGDRLLAISRQTGATAPARQAYRYYADCFKNGGTTFYQDLDELSVEAIERGTVYYRAYDGATVDNNLFLKRLPHGADRQADCEITVDRGPIHFNETRTVRRKRYRKQVITHQRTVTDTAGVTTYEPVFKTVTGTRVTTRVTLTASSHTYKNVHSNTEECFLSDDSFLTHVSDSYNLVRYEGDSRAWPSSTSSQTGQPAFFRSRLKTYLINKINRRI